MSFAEAFTEGFVGAYRDSFDSTSRTIQLRAKDDAERIRKKKEELDKATKADQEILSSAKTLAANLGHDSPEAVTIIANQLKAGATYASLTSAFASGRLSFTGTPGGASTQNAVFNPGDEDQQTTDALEATPEDAEIIPFGSGSSVDSSQPVEDPRAAPTVPSSGAPDTSSPAASDGSTGGGGFGLRVNPRTQTPTVNLAVARDNLTKAQQSGDPARIAQAEYRLNQLLKVEESRGAARSSGEVRTFVKVDENGKPTFTQGYIRQTAQGPQLTDTQDQPLEGFRPVADDERRAGDEALKVINTRITNYNTSLQDVGSALVLADDVISIVNQNPEVLTKVAGGIQALTAFVREANTAASIVGDLIQSSQNKEVTRDQFETTLNRSGALPNGVTVDQLEGLDLSTITNISERKALFDAKVFLLAFRSGALEGQSGQAMSDKDYQRLLKIVYASSNSETFQQQLNDYMRQGVSTLERTSNSLNNSKDGLIGRFEQQYGYNPVAAVVSPVKDYLSSDPRALAAYERVMATRGVGAPPATPSDTQAAPPAAATPTAPQAPVEIPGYTFVRIEGGRAVYVPEGGGEELVDTRYTYQETN